MRATSWHESGVGTVARVGTPAETLETDRGPVEVARAGVGPPVMLIHGTPGGSDSSVAMGRFLVEAGFELIAPSRPSTTRPTCTPRSWTSWAMSVRAS